MKKQLAITSVGLLIMIIGIGAFLGIKTYNNNKKYNDLVTTAISYKDLDKFDDAINLFKKANSIKYDPDIESRIAFVNQLKESKDFYDKALQQMNDKKFIDAIENFKKIYKEDTKRYNTVEGKITECKTKYISSIIDSAKASAMNNDYIKAIAFLNDALDFDTMNQEVKDLKANYTLVILKQKEEVERQAIEDSLVDTVNVSFIVSDTKADTLYDFSVLALMYGENYDMKGQAHSLGGQRIQIDRNGATTAEYFQISLSYTGDEDTRGAEYINITFPLKITYKNDTLNVWVSERDRSALSVTKDGSGTPADGY